MPHEWQKIDSCGGGECGSGGGCAEVEKMSFQR